MYKFPSIGATLAAAALSAAFAAFAAPALAGLGGGADSVATDSQALRGQQRATAFVQYDLQEITSGTLTVHEYLTRAGQVFAVTWQGPTPPNLQQLLGSYFSQLQSASAAQHQLNPGIHRQLNISTANLVVQAISRMRAFQGIAYVPSLVPVGVSVSDLQ